MKVQQEEWVYVKRPGTELVNSSHYEHRKYDVDFELSAGDVLLEAKFLSVDPYMRIQQAASSTWEQPHPLGEVQGSGSILRVIDSKNSDWSVGTVASGYTGWKKFIHLKENQLTEITNLSTFGNLGDVPYSYFLSILGMPARTAYFGLLHAIDEIKPGGTVVVSAAAGAVGSIVLQLAKIKNYHVVAITSSPKKLEWCKQLGADATISYTESNTVPLMQKALMAACPNGIDCYWDNVGGFITDSIWEVMNTHSQVVICGQISTYNGGLDEPEQGPRFLHHVLYKRIRIQGILARDYKHRMKEMYAEILPWLKEKKLRYQETVWKGFASLPDALNSLFSNQNLGKVIVEV